MKNLKRIRLQKLMTQEELAHKSGLTRQTINVLENNENKTCSSQTLVKLSNALGVTVDELLLLP